MTETTSLLSLFIGSFLAATLLPGGSELLLLAILHDKPELLWAAVFSATIGNTLGGLLTFAMGWFLPHKQASSRYSAWLQRYGAPLLLLSWVPIVGDALCLAAGWLRVNVLFALVCLLLGKFLRYVLIAGIFSSLN